MRNVPAGDLGAQFDMSRGPALSSFLLTSWDTRVLLGLAEPFQSWLWGTSLLQADLKAEPFPTSQWVSPMGKWAGERTTGKWTRGRMAGSLTPQNCVVALSDEPWRPSSC